jgi:putative glutamine amidotransferase
VTTPTAGARAPLIAIPTRRTSAEPVAGYQVVRDYVEAVTTAGGAPFLVPPQPDRAALRSLFEMADGLLLAGGCDLEPSLYHEPPHPALRPTEPERDDLELTLARWALADRLPLLGICRGMQLLNVAAGGSLCQDLPSQLLGSLPHDATPIERRHERAHPVAIAPGSALARRLGAEHLLVNSLHHQAVKEVAGTLRAVAAAPDGVIEALEAADGAPACGVQWHPEALSGDDAANRLWRWFVTAAAEWAAAR